MPASSGASAILRVGAPGQDRANHLFPRARGGQPHTGAGFGFRFPSPHRPTKDWLQTPTSPTPKNAAETIGYKFRTNFAES
jgi:hypothetical protein